MLKYNGCREKGDKIKMKIKGKKTQRESGLIGGGTDIQDLRKGLMSTSSTFDVGSVGGDFWRPKGVDESQNIGNETEN